MGYTIFLGLYSSSSGLYWPVPRAIDLVNRELRALGFNDYTITPSYGVYGGVMEDCLLLYFGKCDRSEMREIAKRLAITFDQGFVGVREDNDIEILDREGEVCTG